MTEREIGWDTDLSQMSLPEISSWIESNRQNGQNHTDPIYALFNGVLTAYMLLGPNYSPEIRAKIVPFSPRNAPKYFK
jgi:hypothetical protein